MKFQKGDMWTVYNDADLFLITTNSCVRKDGELVMGRGIAQQAKQLYPTVPKIAGAWIIENNFRDRFYGLITEIFDSPLGMFQVKYHYADAAETAIIDASCEMLAFVMDEHKYSNVHLNYPGIGYGGLCKESVQPILEQHLADVPVTIWEY